jgi:hypothetical protein
MGNRVYFRVPGEIRTSCAVAPTPGVTVARMPNHPDLGCGDQVCIRPLQPFNGLPPGSTYRVEDQGGGLVQAQLDLYRGIGQAVCAGWPNPMSRVIRLGR